MQQQVGLRREADRQRRRNAVAIDELLVAIAVGALTGRVQAECDAVVVERRVEVDGQALVAVAAEPERGFAEAALDIRLLGHAIDEAARGAPAVEHGRRALDDLDALGVG